MKVNAIDISPLKCATHWLYYCAKEHPDIVLPKIGSKGRDSNFFGTAKYLQGINVYEKAFRGHGKIAYDISAGIYGARSNITVSQIHKYNPNVLLTCMVRDPVDRAISHYKYYYRNQYKTGKIPTFQQAFDKDIAGIRSCGKIASGLMDFLLKFNRSQMLITKFEDFRNNQEKYLILLFTFLGIDATFKPKVLNYDYWKRITDQNNYYANDIAKKAIRVGDTQFATKFYTKEYEKIERIEFNDINSI